MMKIIKSRIFSGKRVILATALILLFSTAVHAQSKAQDTEKMIREMYRLLNEQKFDEAAVNVSPAFVDHIMMEGQKPGLEGVRDLFKTMWKAFPDLKQDIIELIVNEDGTRVCALVRMYGTHKGEFMGMPATNNKIDVPASDIILLKEGKITDHWGFIDTETFMKQLNTGK